MFVIVYKVPHKRIAYFAGAGKPLSGKITGALVISERLREQFQALCCNQKCMSIKDMHLSGVAELMVGGTGLPYSEVAKW